MNHTDIKGLFEMLQRFKPNRLPYELICELAESDGVGIDICPYGDLIYNTNYSDYGNTYKHIKELLEKYGYWVASFTGTIFKNLDGGKYDTVGEVR